MQKNNSPDTKSQGSTQVTPQKQDNQPQVKKMFEQVLKLRIEKQTILQASYPDLPLFEEVQLKTFEDLALQISDQFDFLIDKHEEMKNQFSGHYMTQMNKKLIQENKELKGRLERSLTNKMQDMIQKEKENAIERQITSQETTIEQLQKQLTAREKELEGFKQFQVDAQNQSKKEIEMLQQKIEGFEKDNEDLNKTSQGKDKDREALSKKIQAVENEKRDLQNRIQANDENYELLLQKLQKVEKDNAELQKKIQTTDKDNELLKKKILDIQKDREHLLLEINAAQQENQKLQDKVKLSNAQGNDGINKLQKEHEQAIKDLQQQVKEKDLIISNFEAQSQKSIKSQKELTQQIQSQIAQMEQSNQQLQEENSKLNQDNADIYNAYQQMEQQNLQLQDLLKQKDDQLLEQSRQELPEEIKPEDLKQSPVQQRDPRFKDDQEKQLESDMNFSQELLQSIKRSRQGSSNKRQGAASSRIKLSMSPSEYREKMQKKEQEESNDYYTFAQNTKGVAYLGKELQQLKEQVYSKLKFLQIKVAREAEGDQDVDVVGIFRNDNYDLSLFLKEEVNHMQIISNIINDVILQSEEAFKKVHEFQIKKDLVQIIEDKDLSQSVQEIVKKIKERYDTLSQENVLYKAEIEQNLDPKLKALITENQQLRQGKSNPDQNNVFKIENDLLKHEHEKLTKLLEESQEQKDTDFQKYETIIQQLYQENDDLIAKSRVLSTNLNFLAQEVEQLKETNERLTRENQHIRGEYEKTKQVQAKKHNFVVQSEPKTHEVAQFSMGYNRYKRNAQKADHPEPFSNDFRKQMTPAYSEYQLQRSPQYENIGNQKQKEEEATKMNRLIVDYKVENDKCTRKIMELKEKLQTNKYKFYVDRTAVRDQNQSERQGANGGSRPGGRGYSQPNITSKNHTQTRFV